MAEGGGQKIAKRKRLDGDDRPKLLVGEHVEVCYFEEGLTGSWHSAVVVMCGKSYRLVEHVNLLNENQSGKIVEKIPVSAVIDGASRTTLKYCRDRLRPSPPPYEIQKNDIKYGMCVDALINEAWWEGVIFDHDDGSKERTVFFPDLGDQDTVTIDRLRLTRHWDGEFGDWTLRGEWLLFHLLDDLGQKEGLPVSVRQIWYDLRTKSSFSERVKAWYLGTHDVWQMLVSELVQELWSVIYAIPAPEVVYPMQLENLRTSSDVIDVPVAIDFNGWIDSLDTTTPLQFENLLPYLGDIDMSMDGIPCQSTDFSFDESVVNLDTTLPLEQHSTEAMTLHGSSDKRCVGSVVTVCESGETLVGTLNHTLNNFHVTNIETASCFKNKDELSSVSEFCIEWKPVELKSNYCPEVLSLYANSLKEGKTKSKSSRQSCGCPTQLKEKIKMHLLALGWKIDFRDDTMLRYRYRSPEGKTLYSLPQVYNYLMKGAPKKVDRHEANVEVEGGYCHKWKHDMDIVNAPSKLSVAGDSSLIIRAGYQNALAQQVDIEEKMAPNTSKHVAKDAGSSVIRNSTNPDSQNSILSVEEQVDAELSKAEIIHPEYLPEAIKEYEDYIDSRRQSKSSNVDVSLLRLNAKKHLLYMGWYFWLKQKKTKCETFYGAPDGGRSYGSLVQACKAYLTAQKSKIACVSPQEQMNITVKSSDSSGSRNEDSGKKIEKHESCSSSILLVTENQESAKLSEFPDIKFSKSQSRSPISSRTRSLIRPSSLAPVLRSRKRSQNDVSPLVKCSSKTVLSCLIDRNVVLPRQNVYSMCKDGISKKKGRISGQGIKCSCCGQIFTLTKFEAHAGYKTRYPCANIFLDDGRSLLQCQMEIMDSSRYKDFSHRCIKGDYSHYPSDVICSICHYGGDLILCDHCPSTFHTSCLGLKEVPEGKWFCSSCKCSICGDSEFNHDIMQFTTRTMLLCDQCDQEYHVGCLREKWSQELSHCPTGNWFCSSKCSKIYNHLRDLLGKSIPASADGLSWKIMRWHRGGGDDLDGICPEAMAAIHTELSIALDVLHECFVTIIEPRSQTDLSANIVFNKESELKRLNFRGFYTMLLEKGDEVVSVATVRVFDEKVAEMPLIGTSLKFRRQGMCRLLVGEVEKLLYVLGVERLLLPAAPQLVETWTTSFGFTKVENSERIELSKYPILNFQGTTMCRKFLEDLPWSI